VIRLTQSWDVNSVVCSTSWWLFDPGGASAEPSALETIGGAFFSTCIPSLLELQHNAVMPTTCRLAENGVTVVLGAPPAVGAWEGGEANNCAGGLRWAFQGRGRRSWSMTYVPGLPSVFVADGYRINELGFGNMKASGTDFLNAMNLLSGGSGSTLVLGTLQRVLNEAPLGASAFAPYDSCSPISKVVTIRRRIRARSSLSPLP
jgi:hypothetical protein